ncbi:glycosyltransferase family 2 protein [Bdellovibrio sp. 22V]|uniref:glycosyltransferase family 2 protein n=1 Tax=Bdellovibrio sp. 22V TaxID=3044166 RepID=UPI00254374F4|nr:glycosyltransferase family 2 protein [Bdellovibrio sp. 22V]WII71784.1 glycosyltransferase family 2 protein [Bdellovibrio sp. 22V]
MTKLPISLVIITLNEENHIERCIRSAPFADDVVVVDSFSTDRTVEIAEKCGARVFKEAWRGFGPQKAFATSQAKNPWVLSLDADEALSPDLAAEIMQKFTDLDSEAGYLFPRKSFHLGRWISHGGWYPDYQLRLFNKDKSQWNSAALHEKVEVKRTLKMKKDLLHWVFDDLSDQVRTNDRYSTLGAQQMVAKGKRFSYFKLIFKPWGKFVETYFFKGGFRDGLPGFIISVGAAYSLFLKFAKVWEMERVRKKSQG